MRAITTTIALLLIGHGADANEAHDLLSTLSEPERQQVLSRYLEADGTSCDVVDTFFQGASKDTGDAIWNVRCGGGGAFMLLLKAGGSAQMLDCETLAQLNAECFVRFPD